MQVATLFTPNTAAAPIFVTSFAYAHTHKTHTHTHAHANAHIHAYTHTSMRYEQVAAVNRVASMFISLYTCSSLRFSSFLRHWLGTPPGRSSVTRAAASSLSRARCLPLSFRAFSSLSISLSFSLSLSLASPSLEQPPPLSLSFLFPCAARPRLRRRL